MPFGLSSAPYLFTKLLKPLVKKWRTEGKSIVVFLDDGLGAAADHTKARISSLSVHADLLKSGFVPNEEKSLWEPTQVITWLGTVIDTSQCIISATDTRIQSLSEDLSFLLDATNPSLYQVSRLASVCGKIISLGNCVRNVARLMTRNIFAVVNSATNWNSMVSLTPGCVEELNFWKVNLVYINSVPLWHMQWIPRDLNIIADDISKFVDLDDYSINDGVFYSLDELWGPHTCDRFACHYNAKLPNSTPDSISQAPPVSMPLRKIGPMTTTGCVPPSFSNL